MKINLQDLILNTEILKFGQKILFSGIVYTIRDIAHRKIFDTLIRGDELPFDFSNIMAIYYCGPSPTKPGNVVGACGPTTSSRVDVFTPTILDKGVKVLIGKGNRSDYVLESIKRNKAIYFIATGGTAAIISKTVKRVEFVAFNDLGPEAIYKFEIKDMPLITAIDSFGNNIFKIRRNNAK
ncbi:MAG: FumA C-terminus/TtdB family hydratase beta subunit [Endomicrobium sp.]|jgi:fumarate hydratase subunit beta|nr:FumA C-terminus/TtdB family hydratase beta subunit [Endomicrobium sp.]